MSAHSDTRRFIAELGTYEGVEVRKGGEHSKVFVEGVGMVGTVPSTPSDHRWKRNMVSQMRLAGFDMRTWPKKKQSRDADGQAPPPLPVIGKEQSVMAGRNPNYSTTPALVVERATTVAKEVKEHFDLPVRAGRVIAHGTIPKLVEIGLAYAEQTGTKIPHMNYVTRDVTNRKEMMRLAAEKLSDVVVYGIPERGITVITEKQIGFVHDVWTWFKDNGYHIPGEVKEMETTSAIAQTKIEELADANRDRAESWTARYRTVTGNGHLPTQDEMLVMRLIAKLAYNGVAEDESVAMGYEVYEALQR